MKKGKKTKVNVYEGKLPELVAKDFEYAGAYNAEGRSTDHDTEIGGRIYLKPEDHTDTARAAAINNAVSDLVKTAEREMKHNPSLGIELLADLNVVREIKSLRESSNPNRTTYNPHVEVKVEAIGYKKRLK